MSTTTGKRIAKVKLTLTKRTVENLQPADKPWIAWDDRLSGFGVRVQPSGTKAFIVNYRTGSGGRRARNRRVAISRCDHLAPEEARRLAQELLGRVARSDDPAQERAESRGIPTLREAFEEYLTANPNRKSSTEALYRSQMRYCLGDWLSRPLDTITRREVEARFHLVSQRNGWAVANHIISLLRSVYRRPSVDHEKLRNPVELWLAGGGRYHRAVRRRISTPAEVLPRTRRPEPGRSATRRNRCPQEPPQLIARSLIQRAVAQLSRNGISRFVSLTQSPAFPHGPRRDSPALPSPPLGRWLNHLPVADGAVAGSRRATRRFPPVSSWKYGGIGARSTRRNTPGRLRATVRGVARTDCSPPADGSGPRPS